MPLGKIVFEVQTANGALPINNVTVTVTTQSGYVISRQVLTGSESGVSAEIPLIVPEKYRSLNKDNKELPYSTYNAEIVTRSYYRIVYKNIQVFDTIVSVINAQLIPLPASIASSDTVAPIVIVIPPHSLFERSAPTSKQLRSKDVFLAKTVPSRRALPTVNIAAGVFIPETVTVHLGPPDRQAENVTVSFTDYLKNVASSEIYPTWPIESLYANIIAQSSLVLNRIYTEWYRSMGYGYDITNDTGFDQAFVKDRNIFDSVSRAVDTVFNTYIRQIGSVAPYYAEFCNGTTSTCPGLSQWGTVALADQGFQYEEILLFYYSNVEVVTTNKILPATESFPGVTLSLGSSGEDVRIIQEHLNRIAINFPQIPLVEVTGTYTPSTEESVKAFQSIYQLPVTGTVDKATWYRISYIYVAVKKLAQLTSEGQRPSYNERKYPGYTLQFSSKGSEVQEIQYYFSRINIFNSAIPNLAIDGIYGRSTENAVKAFQSYYGLSVTGVINEETWYSIVDVYLGTLENVDVPDYLEQLRQYPGTPIGVGAQGQDVLYLQQLLNVINDIFVQITDNTEDGIFGAVTKQSVQTFQKIFGLSPSGTVDGETWDRINSVYVSVGRRCIFAYGNGTGTKSYPNVPYASGSSGENVIYIQGRINAIRSAIPSIIELDVDGRFGPLTESAVKDLQAVFGLTADGIVDEPTWLLINYIYSAVMSGCLTA